MQTVYLDHAATTPPDPEVLEAMYPYLKQHYGNAHSPHQHGRKANGAVESARKNIADALDADPSNIVFTSGGTESNNALIKGIAQVSEGTEIVTSKAEHHAVLNAVEYCRSLGMKPVYLDPAPDGTIQTHQVAEALSDQTALVTLMHVNNELGSINPIPEIASLCRRENIPFHTDAVQSLGKVPVNIREMQVDFLSISGHKLHAPKGIGLMYVGDPDSWTAWMHGGSQEANRRAGTLNVPGIMALSKAVSLSVDQREARSQHVLSLRRKLLEGLDARLGDRFCVNGPENEEKAVPHILNLTFTDYDGKPVDGEILLMNLDMEGVCASSGSACASGAVEPSHVLQSIGMDREEAQSAVRFSLGKDNTEEQIQYTLQVLEKVLDRIIG